MPSQAYFFQTRHLPSIAMQYGMLYHRILMEVTNIHNNIEANLCQIDKNIHVDRDNLRVTVRYKDLLIISQHLCFQPLQDFEDYVLAQYPDYKMLEPYAILGYCYNVVLRRPDNETEYNG